MAKKSGSGSTKKTARKAGSKKRGAARRSAGSKKKAAKAEALLVTKDITIGEVVQRYPGAAPVMLDYGLHCIGCHINPFESVEQGAMGHGMDKKTFERMMADVNKAAASAAKKRR